MSPAAAKPEKGTHGRLRAALKRLERRQHAKVYEAVHARDGRVCQHCGLYCGQSIHVHHVVFRSLGGGTTVENLLSVCQRCHRNIHKRTP
jgi:5-methylcytosine-specific restriction endonuclease McrA